MKYRIVGADRETGEDVEFIIDAPNEGAADLAASRRNIMVSGIAPFHLAQQSAVTRNLARPPLEAGHALNASSINVHLPRRSSSLGIAACILGILAFLICWVPLIGLVGVPLSALGLLLGIFGLLVAMFRRGAGIGFAIAGSAVSGLALFVAIGATYAAGRAIEHSAKSVSAAMKEAEKTNQQVIRATPPTAGDRPEQPPAPASQQVEITDVQPLPWPAQPQARGSQQQERAAAPAPSQAPEAAEQRASADDTLRQGDVTVCITSVRIGKVPLKGEFDGSDSESADPLLAIRVRITNVGANKKVQYRSFMGGDVSFSRDYASLRDNFDNVYKRTHFGFGSTPTGATKSKSIYPGKSITDVLIFELPIDTAQYLDLDLPAQNFGGEGMLRFQIPAQVIGGRRDATRSAPEPGKRESADAPRAQQPSAPAAPLCAPFQAGEIRASVTGAAIGKVRLVRTSSGNVSESSDSYLRVTVELANLSETHEVGFSGWESGAVSLQDDQGHVYGRRDFAPAYKVAESTGARALPPGTKTVDVLVFDRPAARLNYLVLELPAASIGGGADPIRFEIPAQLIQR